MSTRSKRDKAIWRLATQGLPHGVICQRLGVSTTTIWRVMREMKNSHVHVVAEETEAMKARRIGERVYMKIQTLGTRQVRFYDGMVLTYPYPARGGYGVRGVLIGIYNAQTPREWVLEDVMQVLSNPNGSES